MGADRGDILHLLAIGADQRFKRRLGRAIGSPISAGCGGDRGCERDYPRVAAGP